MDDLEQAAREACRYTWEREFSGKNLDAYVETHWKDHLVGMRRASAPFLATISRLTAENEGLTEALKEVRGEVVLAIAFLTRDNGTDRLPATVSTIIDKLALADRTARAALATPSDPDARPAEDFADAFHRIRNKLEWHKSRTVAEVVERNDGLRRIAGEKNQEYAARIIATYLALTATLPDAEQGGGK